MRTSLPYGRTSADGALDDGEEKDSLPQKKHARQNMFDPAARELA
jgi:hypothetical protein